MHALLLRRWGLVWAGLLLCVLALGLLRRHMAFAALAEEYAVRLTPIAECGSPTPAPDEWSDPELDLYLYGDYRAANYTPPMQGPCVFLFNRGYRNPKLLRAVLLTEARRCYDWQYTYSRVRNYDLRRGLMRQCLRLYPDDLRVAWACGQLNLAAGDWEEARQQLARVVEAAGSMARLREFGNSIGRKGRHILGRYCAALTICGQDEEAGELLWAWHAQDPQDRDVNWALAHWLLDNGEYEAVIELLGPQDNGEWAHPIFDAAIVYEAAKEGLHKVEPSEVARLKSEWKNLWKEPRPKDAAWDEQHRHAEKTVDVAVPLSRQLIKVGQSKEAMDVLSSVDVQLVWTYGKIDDLASMTLLAAVASDKYLSPREHRGEDGQDYVLYFGDSGFTDLLNTDALVRTMRSPLFAEAIRQRGVSFEQLKPQLYAVIQPARDNYSDYSNGDLLPGAL